MAFRIGTYSTKEVLIAFAAMSDGGILELRTGAHPASVAAAATGTLLATLDFPNPALANGNIVSDFDYDLPIIGSAVAGGTIGWGRAYTAGGTNALWDGLVTLSGNGGDIISTVLSVVISDSIQVTNINMAMPLS